MSEIKNSKTVTRIPILIGLTLAGGILLGATLFGGKSKSFSNLGKNINKYREILSWIDNSYVDSVDTDTLVDYSIKKMLERLDPHTSYIPTKDVAMARSQLESGFDGIGVEFNIFNDTVYVVTPLTGGPSEAAGIVAGDKIVKADGTPLTGKALTNSLIFSKLRGPRGSQVKLEIVRKGTPKPILFTISRDKIPTFSVDAGYMIDNQTGYVKVTRFSESTYDEFRNVVTSLKGQGMKQLLLDLRGNPGGYMDRATNMADELIGGNKLIVYTDGKGTQYDKQTFANREGMFEKGAVVVMVDEGSASASEIVAGALQDNDRALIVGRRSFGKGLVQMPIPLSDGSEMRLTISRYYTPSGRSIQKPYLLGDDKEYDHDYEKRLKSGEFYNADSVKINKKLAYKTAGGRMVYGGGGIIPDVFVSRDTSYFSNYLIQLMSKNIIREYAFNYAQDNKASLEKQKFADFLKGFTTTDAMLGEMIKMAEKSGTKLNEKEWTRSKNYVKALTKAYIARQLWNKKANNGLNNEFYQVMSNTDETFQKALKQFDKADKLARGDMQITQK
ncbi:MAG: S41 family peptidase [Spirosomataceae bacterium]